MLILQCWQVEYVDGIEDDADEEDAEKTEGERDSAQHPRQHYGN